MVVQGGEEMGFDLDKDIPDLSGRVIDSDPLEGSIEDDARVDQSFRSQAVLVAGRGGRVARLRVNQPPPPPEGAGCAVGEDEYGFGRIWWCGWSVIEVGVSCGGCRDNLSELSDAVRAGALMFVVECPYIQSPWRSWIMHTKFQPASHQNTPPTASNIGIKYGTQISSAIPRLPLCRNRRVRLFPGQRISRARRSTPVLVADLSQGYVGSVVSIIALDW